MFGGRPTQLLLPPMRPSNTATGRLVSFASGMNPAEADRYNVVRCLSLDGAERNVSLIVTGGC